MAIRFDEADAMLSDAIDGMLGQTIIWRPMRKRQVNIYTNTDTEEDPERPVRDDLIGIASWRPSNVDVGTQAPTGELVVADCVVDFAVTQFAEGGVLGLIPQEGDIFELSEEYVGNNVVRVDRSGDDGTVRLYFYCTPE